MVTNRAKYRKRRKNPLYGRILDALRILFLLVRLNDKCETFNAAQARAEKALARRAKKDEKERAALEQPPNNVTAAPMGSPSDHVSGRSARRNQLRLAAAAQGGDE
jgi:hypothetical protein